MPKYLIMYDYGYGQNHDVIEAENQEKADQEAYELWRDGAESQADYSAEILTPELAEEHGFEDELDDETA